MSRRRILTVVESLGRGGAERLVVNLHDRLPRSRYDLRVASLTPPDDLAEELREMKVRVYSLGLELPRDLPRAVWKLRRFMAGYRVDLVHTHLYFANVAGRLAAWRKAPVVSTLHDTDYGLLNSGTVGARAWKWLDGATGRRLCDRLLAVSEAVREDYERELGFEDIEVVRNCMPVSSFRERLEDVDPVQARRTLGVSQDQILLLHVGRFHRRKGQDLLLRALRVARTEDPRLRLLLVGKGETMGEMRGLAEQLGLEDAALFLGEVADPLSCYRAADVFVFPSRHEAFGMALLEAMAAGLPAVVSDTGGIRELATAESARFVAPGLEEELARTLLEVAGDAELRSRMGAAALERARDFDVSEWVPRLEEIYREVSR